MAVNPNSKIINKIVSHVKEGGKYGAPAVLFNRNGSVYLKNNGNTFIETKVLQSDLLTHEIFDEFESVLFIVENVKEMEKTKKSLLGNFTVKESEQGKILYIEKEGSEFAIAGESKNINIESLENIIERANTQIRRVVATEEEIGMLMDTEKVLFNYDNFEIILSKKALPTLRKKSHIEIEFEPVNNDIFKVFILLSNEPGIQSIDVYECLHL